MSLQSDKQDSSHAGGENPQITLTAFRHQPRARACAGRCSSWAAGLDAPASVRRSVTASTTTSS